MSAAQGVVRRRAAGAPPCVAAPLLRDREPWVRQRACRRARRQSSRASRRSSPSGPSPTRSSTTTPRALGAALPELARLYEDAGVRAWTVWVPEGRHVRCAPALGRRTRPRREPDGDGCRAGRARPGAAPRARPGAHGRCRGGRGAQRRRVRAARTRFSLAFAGLPDGDGTPLRRTRGRRGRRLHWRAMDLDGDCEICMVATLPAARGRGLCGELMRTRPARGAWSGAARPRRSRPRRRASRSTPGSGTGRSAPSRCGSAGPSAARTRSAARRGSRASTSARGEDSQSERSSEKIATSCLASPWRWNRRSTPSCTNPSRSSAACERACMTLEYAPMRSSPSARKASAATSAFDSALTPVPHHSRPSQVPTTAR